ncbi:hypothetical protein [Pseudonocardia humida]|uniref:hypothetical protein n=1 Tax=Pseudonocardia humida TaxID=2800819 RepID=UPI00207C707D|nr:hypothetical protein [Pseudonocardia humida]
MFRERDLTALDDALLGGSPFGVPVAVVTGPLDGALYRSLLCDRRALVVLDGAGTPVRCGRCCPVRPVPRCW